MAADMDAINAALAEMDGDYMDTPEMPDNLPKGTYQVRIDKAHMGQTKDKGYPMVKFEATVLNGQHEGMKAFWVMTIRPTKEAYAFLKRDLKKLGYDGPVSGIPGQLEAWLGLCLEINRTPQKDDPDQFNTRLNKRIDVADQNGGYSGPEADFAPPPEAGGSF